MYRNRPQVPFGSVLDFPTRLMRDVQWPFRRRDEFHPAAIVQDPWRSSCSRQCRRELCQLRQRCPDRHGHIVWTPRGLVRAMVPNTPTGPLAPLGRHRHRPTCAPIGPRGPRGRESCPGQPLIATEQQARKPHSDPPSGSRCRSTSYVRDRPCCACAAIGENRRGYRAPR
jgi:hypothetical protein